MTPQQERELLKSVGHNLWNPKTDIDILREKELELERKLKEREECLNASKTAIPFDLIVRAIPEWYKERDVICKKDYPHQRNPYKQVTGILAKKYGYFTWKDLSSCLVGKDTSVIRDNFDHNEEPLVSADQILSYKTLVYGKDKIEGLPEWENLNLRNLCNDFITNIAYKGEPINEWANLFSLHIEKEIENVKTREQEEIELENELKKEKEFDCNAKNILFKDFHALSKKDLLRMSEFIIEKLYNDGNKGEPKQETFADFMPLYCRYILRIIKANINAIDAVKFGSINFADIVRNEERLGKTKLS